MTSLDMAGFQISILNISEHLEWLQHLDASTEAPAWPATCISIPIPEANKKTIQKNDHVSMNKVDYTDYSF